MKKVIIVIITGIAVFIIVTLLMNKCTSVLRESIENETKKANNKTEKKYDINIPCFDYNLDSYDDWYDYINYINDNYIDEKLRGYANIRELVRSYEELKVYDENEVPLVLKNVEQSRKEYYTGHVIKQSIIYPAHKFILSNNLLKQNNDWKGLPLTENFKNKFNEKDGVLKYYNLPEDLIDKGELNGLFSITITDNIPNDYESIKYEFICIFNDEGYFDNIYYFGRYMEEYMPPDSIKLEIELDDVDVIKACVHEICVSEEYLMKGGDELTDFDDYISGMNNLKINHKYRDEVFHSNGILPIKDYLKDSLEVISYDENIKEAIVKIETEDKKIYYKIKLDIDEYYCLDNATVELDREEDR